MGNFYTNYTVRSTDQAAVASALSGRSAMITPVLNGSLVVFDEESDSQSPGVLTELGARLSKSLRCPVLAILNHDDDILVYELHESGVKTDAYCSAPGYFGGEDAPPSGGDARKLCAAFGSAKIDEVAAILHPPDGERPTFAVQQHAALVDALATSSYGVGMGFTYVASGELPEDLSEEDLVTVE